MTNKFKTWMWIGALGLVLGACGDDSSADNDVDAGSDETGGTAGTTAGTGTAGTGTAGTAGTGTAGTGTAGTGTAGTGSEDPKPLGKDNPPDLGKTIDRMGRPAIATALHATFEADMAKKDAAKDEYNEADPKDWADFSEGFQASLGILDGLDGTCGNQLLAGAGADRYKPLADVLVDDQLYVNTDSGTCGVYLGVEAEAVSVLTAGMGGCGGRTPLEDVIDRSYSVLAAGLLTGVDDTITEDDETHDITKFPWLAAPQD